MAPSEGVGGPDVDVCLPRVGSVAISGEILRECVRYRYQLDNDNKLDKLRRLGV